MVAALVDFIAENSQPTAAAVLSPAYSSSTNQRRSAAPARLDFTPEQSLRFGADAAVADVARTAQAALPRDCAVWSDSGSRCGSDPSVPAGRIAWQLLHEHRLDGPSRYHCFRY